MVKSELCKLLARQFSHIPEQDVLQAVNLLLEFMRNSLCTQERIEIRDFGNFTLKHYAARKSRNPRTGETLHTPPRTRPHFKMGKKLRERINT